MWSKKIMTGSVVRTFSIGRDMITRTKECCETMLPGSRVIYGDSVLGDTPLMVRRGDLVNFIRIDELFNEGRRVPSGGDKEYRSISGVWVWSDKGFTPVKHVVRHQTAKRIFRVTTNAGMVDVTEDHSLLLNDGTPVRPAATAPGVLLLHRAAYHSACAHAVTEEEGSMSAHFFSSFYKALVGMHSEGGHQQVPEKMLFAPLEAVRSFVKQISSTKGDKLVMRCEGKLAAAGLVYMAQRLGYCSFRFRVDDGKYRIACSTVRMDDGVRSIVELPACAGYVYDLETENHHFGVGPGNLIVHNTDSVFWDLWPSRTIQENHDVVKDAFLYCESAAAVLSANFPAPNKLEFEKVFCPLLLFGKKRYSGKLYSADLGYEKAKKIDNKGLQLVRRDSIPFLRTLMADVLGTIHEEYSHYKASRSVVLPPT